jgi:hypothetical protein
MAAPTPVALGTPTGVKLKDGYSSRVAFSLNASIELWIKSYTPPPMDGGDPIDQTTMHNLVYRTKAPRGLIDSGMATLRCAYDPNCYSSLLALINREGTITYWFGDASNVSFYGYMNKFEPQELTEGSQPEATVSIVQTNWDNVNKVEAGPYIVSTTGT